MLQQQQQPAFEMHKIIINWEEKKRAKKITFSLSLSLLCGRKVTFQTIGGDLKSTIKHDWSCELGGWIFSMSYLLHLSYVASSGASSSSSNFISKFIIIDGHQPTTSLLALSNCRYLIGKPFSYFNKFLNYLLGTATSKKIKVIENSQMLVDKIL